MRLVILAAAVVLALITGAVPPPRAPSPIAVLQHRIEAVSDRVHDAVSDLRSARTPAEKSHANAALVDLRLELADLSDRVEHERLQSQR